MHKPKTVSKRAAELFARLESTPAYQIEGLKIELAEQIYLAMQEQKINNADLARRLDTSRAYITRILQGDVNFTLETMGKIAHALNCEFTIELKPKVVKSNWSDIREHKHDVLPFQPELYRVVRTITTFKETNHESIAAAA